MSEKFKLACGSDSEFFGHNANSQRLRVTKPPVDVSEDIYFLRWLFEGGRIGLDTAERCRREFVWGIGEDKKKNGLHIERTDDNI